MKQFLKPLLFTLVFLYLALGASVPAKAQDPVTEAIKQGIIKVIKAIDLQVQRIQTKTIWLQNAQKVVENTMSELKLGEIADWAQRQKTLYADYFDELYKVKDVISYYQAIKAAKENQLALFAEYKRAYGLFKQDHNFSGDELEYMGKVYAGILNESVTNLNQIVLVLTSFSTQMTDAQRLKIINTAATAIASNFSDLKAFNAENIQLTLQRSKDMRQIEIVRKLYGIE